jgi:hypothetical protein
MSSQYLLEELQQWRAEAKQLRRDLDAVSDLMEDIILILDANDAQTAKAVIHRALKSWETK